MKRNIYNNRPIYCQHCRKKLIVKETKNIARQIFDRVHRGKNNIVIMRVFLILLDKFIGVINKIKEAGLSLIDSVAVQVPTIEGATVAFECKVIGQFETGDHTVFVGEVVATRGEPQKAGHLYVTSNYEFFSLEGSRVPSR